VDYVKTEEVLKEGRLKDLIGNNIPVYVVYNHPDKEKCAQGLAVVHVAPEGVYLEPWGSDRALDETFDFQLTGDTEEECVDVGDEGTLTIYRAVEKRIKKVMPRRYQDKYKKMLSLQVMRERILTLFDSGDSLVKLKIDKGDKDKMAYIILEAREGAPAIWLYDDGTWAYYDSVD
jgi:hypothetical protein